MFIYLFVMAGILWMYHWHATLIVECVGIVVALIICLNHFDIWILLFLFFRKSHENRNSFQNYSKGT